MALTVRVIAPDKTVWDSEAEEVILPSTTGQLGILPGHAPLLTALDIGVMRVKANKTWTPIALMGGFAEVDSNQVIILVNGAERGESIDATTARAAYEAAEAELARVNPEDKQAVIQTRQAVKRTRARLQASEGLK
ncbi:MAG: F0F1 ATP synthase subunit epsilon [Cyanobacteria bacterium REEB459]|nr:F0F1 ATP synthase subunit epsilon [Cyanobacteria bacterium REEB459]